MDNIANIRQRSRILPVLLPSNSFRFGCLEMGDKTEQEHFNLYKLKKKRYEMLQI